MKQFKAIDLVLQLILISICTIGSLINPDSLFMAYAIVGSWQVISAVTHLIFYQRYTALRARKYYGFIVILLFIGAALFINSRDGSIYYGVMMLIVSPFLAIWYAWICYIENKRLQSAQQKN